MNRGYTEMLTDKSSIKPRTTSRKANREGDDELLSLRVERALREVGCHPLNELRVEADNGNVTLHGVVPTYYLKQIAQCVAMRFENVHSVDNQLIVR